MLTNLVPQLYFLQPGCEYIVQLKSSEVNVHIERSTPKFRKIQVIWFDPKFNSALVLDLFLAQFHIKQILQT